MLHNLKEIEMKEQSETGFNSVNVIGMLFFFLDQHVAASPPTFPRIISPSHKPSVKKEKMHIYVPS